MAPRTAGLIVAATLWVTGTTGAPRAAATHEATITVNTSDQEVDAG